VIQRDVPIHAEWVGQTYGESDLDIPARVDGWLEGIHFKEGSEVKEGTLLYTIDPREPQERVAAAEGTLAAARTRLAQAENDVRRYKPLAAINAVSKRDLEMAEATAGAAKGEVEAAQAALESAKIRLGYTQVKAPLDGMIGLTKARVGDYVGRSSGIPVLNTISRLDPIRVRFSIAEAEYLDFVRRLRKQGGTPESAEIAVEMILADGSSHPQAGALRVAERRVDPTTGTLRIEASFPNPEKIVRPGQFAKVRMVVETRPGAILAPQRAVQELQGRFQVVVVAGGQAEIRAVKPGARIGSLWLIDEGLKAGDRVVVEGLQRVRGNQPVTAKEAPAEDPEKQEKPAKEPSSAKEPAKGAPAAPVKPPASGTKAPAKASPAKE
jgi:membrane fusion protein (multidrug efflux system)